MTLLQAEARPRATGAAIIEIDNVVKNYDTGTQQVRALKAVSLNVLRGEMVAIRPRSSSSSARRSSSPR